jgi:Ser-tRNA(Ala) deacylase AlaX
MTTDELFREDATLLHCEATVLAVDEGGIVLDRTVFYPLGGGQAGDAGELLTPDGRRVAITDTRKHKERPGAIAHVPAADAPVLQPGDRVSARIDADRRHAHMRFHTATHLLCALVPHPVDGCSITAAYARLDFHMNEPLDKDALTPASRAGGRGAPGAPPLDQRGRARCQPGLGAQHERAAAARTRPRARARDRRRGPAALRRHACGQYRRP